MSKTYLREKRRKRIRKKIFGTEQCPRLSVFKSNRHIYAQIIDDAQGVTIVSASSMEKGLCDRSVNSGLSKQVGLLIGERAIQHGITKVVFDRSGYKYHGNINSLAEGAREKGLQF